MLRGKILLSDISLGFMSKCYIHGLHNQFKTNVYCNYSFKLNQFCFSIFIREIYEYGVTLIATSKYYVL